VFENQLWVYFREANGNGILCIRSEDGDSFVAAPGWNIGLNCDGCPRIASAGDVTGQCLVATDRGGNGIMRAAWLPIS